MFHIIHRRALIAAMAAAAVLPFYGVRPGASE